MKRDDLLIKSTEIKPPEGSTVARFAKRLRDNPRMRQSSLLLGINLAGVPIGIGTSVLLTRYLGPEVYGDYKFILNLLTISVILFSFGAFYAGNRAIVQNHNRERTREYYGSTLLVTLALSLLISLLLLIYAGFDPNIRDKGLQSILIQVAPFAGLFLLVTYFETLFQADNRIGLLAASRFLPRLLLFLGVLMLWITQNGTGSGHLLVWCVVFGTKAVVFAFLIYRIGPLFRNAFNRFRELWIFTKSYGFHVYSGKIFAVGFAQASGILISYFGTDNTEVGYYMLALTLASPLLFIPNVVGTSYFRDFASLKRIPMRLTAATFGISLACLMLLWLLADPFVSFLYGSGFQPVIQLLYIISFGVILHGLADYFNRFLGAHGRGKALRNGSVIVGTGILGLNLLLIPSWGATGAAWAKASGGGIYLAVMIWYYQDLTRSLSPSDQNNKTE